MSIKKVGLDITKLSTSKREINSEVKQVILLEEKEIRAALSNDKTMKSIVDQLNKSYKTQMTEVEVSYPDPKNKGKMKVVKKKPTITSSHIHKVLDLPKQTRQKKQG